MKKHPDTHERQSFLNTKTIYILFGLLILFTITILALAAATLGVVVNRLNSKNTSSVDKSNSISLVDQIKIDDLMKHLERLQVFAYRSHSNGTRVITTVGFNDTLDYITSQLEQNTNLIIQHQLFTRFEILLFKEHHNYNRISMEILLIIVIHQISLIFSFHPLLLFLRLFKLSLFQIMVVQILIGQAYSY